MANAKRSPAKRGACFQSGKGHNGANRPMNTLRMCTCKLHRRHTGERGKKERNGIGNSNFLDLSRNKKAQLHVHVYTSETVVKFKI